MKGGGAIGSALRGHRWARRPAPLLDKRAPESQQDRQVNKEEENARPKVNEVEECSGPPVAGRPRRKRAAGEMEALEALEATRPSVTR